MEMPACPRPGPLESHIAREGTAAHTRAAVHSIDKEFSLANQVAEQVPSDLYKADYIGSGTFLIKKPKRSAKKRRQSKLKGLKRGMRKS